MSCRRRRCRANSRSTLGQCFEIAVISILEGVTLEGVTLSGGGGASPPPPTREVVLAPHPPPALPPLSAAVICVILRNIAIGPWLRYLSSKKANYK